MEDEPDVREPSPMRAARGRRFRRHELTLVDGGKLVLHGDGTIEHRDDHGVTTRSWAPDDPAWPDQAIRFGLHPEARTVRPDGRSGQGPRPPSW